MTKRTHDKPDPKLDLVLERIVDVPLELAWKAWTQPEHVKQWFTPKPWTTTKCEIDLRPGGIFSTVMRSPEGEEFPNIGCYLELIENRKLVWTDALLPGYRPAEATRHPFGSFTGVITFEPHNGGTKYRAMAMHKNAVDAKTHADMGFHEGWGTCLDQLVAYMTNK